MTSKLSSHHSIKQRPRRSVALHISLIFFISLLGTGCQVANPSDPLARASAYLSTRNNIFPAIKQDLLSRKPCSQEILQTLSQSPCEDVRALVALNPSVTPPLLAQLSIDHDSYVRSCVAANTQTSSDVVAGLSTDSDVMVRSAAATNPHLSKNILLSMFQRKEVALGAFAKNPNCSEVIFESIFDSGDQSARIHLAANPGISEKLMELLSIDKLSIVKQQLAQNSKIPTPLLAALAEDRDPEVNKHAKAALQTRIARLSETQKK